MKRAALEDPGDRTRRKLGNVRIPLEQIGFREPRRPRHFFVCWDQMWTFFQLCDDGWHKPLNAALTSGANKEELWRVSQLACGKKVWYQVEIDKHENTATSTNNESKKKRDLRQVRVLVLLDASQIRVRGSQPTLDLKPATDEAPDGGEKQWQFLDRNGWKNMIPEVNDER